MVAADICPLSPPVISHIQPLRAMYAGRVANDHDLERVSQHLQAAESQLLRELWQARQNVATVLDHDASSGKLTVRCFARHFAQLTAQAPHIATAPSGPTRQTIALWRADGLLSAGQLRNPHAAAAILMLRSLTLEHRQHWYPTQTPPWHWHPGISMIQRCDPRSGTSEHHSRLASQRSCGYRGPVWHGRSMAPLDRKS